MLLIMSLSVRSLVLKVGSLDALFALSKMASTVSSISILGA